MGKINQFLESDQVKGLAKSSRATYGYALQHLRAYLETVGVDVIGQDLADHCPGFILYLKQRCVSGRSIQYYCRVVRIMMRHHGMPVPGFTYRLTNDESHQHKKRQSARWLTEGDVKRCLEYEFPVRADKQINRTRNHLIVRLMAETGCRINEIAEMRRANVDLDAGTIYVGKSKTVARTVFMSPETAQVMGRYIKTAGLDHRPTVRLFQIKTKMIQHIIREMLEDLGIKAPGRLTHVFRHYVATYLFYRGEMDINDIAFLLGDKPQTIRDVYIHPTDDMLGDRVRKGFGW